MTNIEKFDIGKTIVTYLKMPPCRYLSASSSAYFQEAARQHFGICDQGAFLQAAKGFREKIKFDGVQMIFL